LNIIKILKDFKNEILNNDNKKIFNKCDFFKSLKKYISKIQGIKNFLLIGDISIPFEGTEVNLEVHCRHRNSEKEGELEILFNDVTRTKLKEKQNAEFKYKSLFLSKIAHEFKNPLICISELLNQSYEQLPKNVRKDSKIMSNLEQIKSLANFLQILIKDLHYFSESQFGKISEFEEKETNLQELVDFCNKMGKTLLLKSNKVQKVDFNIKLDERIPEKIMTDEWRLKQILINLISNSVKFTLYGSINVEMTLESNKINNEDILPQIKFSVNDTGIGIRENKQKNMFKPFQKDSTTSLKVSNEFGTGLGLSIANEIASKLGTGLKFESRPGEGSIFWFYINLPKELLKSDKLEVPKIMINGNLVPNEHNALKFKSETDIGSGCDIVNSDNNCMNDSFQTKELNELTIIKPDSCYSQITSESEEGESFVFQTVNLNRNTARKATNKSKFLNVIIYKLLIIL
jgi:signal transduction histidine kinase